MTIPIDPQIPPVAAKLIERRKLTMLQEARHEQAVIAARMAAEGTLLTGGFVVRVTKAYVTAFEAYAHGSIQDVLGLLRQSVETINSELAGWVKECLESAFDREVQNLCPLVAGRGPMSDQLPGALLRGLTESAAAMKRDLGIELDLAALARSQPAVVSDEAFADVLVPLQNRRGLEHEFSLHTSNLSEPMCFVFFDIDNFKQVNDKGGSHAIGDEALISIAEAAAKCVKGKGKAFRFAGDEFAMILPNHTLQEGLALAERFRREVNAPPRTSKELTLSVSVGVAEWPSHGADFTSIQEAADKANYDAKARGKNLVRYFKEPEPVAPSAREPERRQPEPNGLSAQAQVKIREDFFRQRVARCPNDQALLHVEDVTSMGQPRNSLYVSCPLCGLNAVLD